MVTKGYQKPNIRRLKILTLVGFLIFCVILSQSAYAKASKSVASEGGKGKASEASDSKKSIETTSNGVASEESPASSSESSGVAAELLEPSGELAKTSGSEEITASPLPSPTRPLAPDAHRYFKTDLLTGSGSFNLPIALPPGRGDTQPNVSLIYSSADGNGWCGVGWDLALGSIQRSTKRGFPKYDSTDAFISSFNGLNLELVDIGGLEYRAKLESQFLRFYYHSSGSFWEVTDKNGTKYFFGSDYSSKLNNDKGIFKWCLDKVVDIHGNYMTISYIKDEGQIYPSRLAYAGNERTGEQSKCSVEFILQDRVDAPPNYRSGSKIRTAKRLYQIDVKVNGSRVRKYVLDYTYSEDTNRSLLSSVTQYGSDGVSALPPVTFNYQSGGGIGPPEEVPEVGQGDNIWNIQWSTENTNFPESDLILYPDSTFSDGTRINDWGDTHSEASGVVTGGSWSSDTQSGNFQCQGAEGSAFCIWTYLYVSEPTTLTLSLSSDTNPACFLNQALKRRYGATCEYVEPRYSPELALKKGYNLIEITGYSQSGGFDGEAFDLTGAPVGAVEVMSSKTRMFTSPVGDFNGDALTDIGSYNNLTGRWEVALSQGENFASYEEWWVDTTTSIHCMPVGGDFNGDGRTDVGTYSKRSGTTDIAFSNGSGFDYAFNFASSQPWERSGQIPFTGDFNGDGLTDIGYTWSGGFGWVIFLSDGSSFSPDPDMATGAPFEFFGSPIVGDFNGDGLADLCAFDIWNGIWRVTLSKGEPKYDDFSTWLTDFGVYQTTPLSADFNNDGLTDVGFFDESIGRWKVALSDGTKFVPAGIWLDSFGQGDIWAPQCGDYNGDGLLDAGIFNTSSVEGTREAIAYGRGPVPDLLSQVSNGVGGTITITYKPSSQFENTFLPFPVQVVDSVTRDDGLGHQYTTTYSYSDGLYDAGDREFRGFGYVKMNDPEGNITETWFHQDDIRKGKISKQQVSDSSGNLYSKVISTWESSNPYPGHPEVNFPYLASQDSFTYDGDETFKQTRTSYEYDNFGNITATINYGEVEGSVDVGQDKRSTHTDYVYNEASWILNRPSHTYIKNNGGTKVSESWYYYDNHLNSTDPPTLGDLTKEVKWLATGPNPTTTMGYDLYGNLTSTTDARGNTTTTAYDTAYHTYPETVTNALGHTQRFTYDPGTGQLLTSTDPNNNTTRNEYDVFGRLSKVFGPDDDSLHPGVRYEYDLESFPTKVITYAREESNSDKVLTSYIFYDGLGQAIQTRSEAEDPAKHVVSDTVTYNSKGQVKKRCLPYFADRSVNYSPPHPAKPRSVIEYDPMGRVRLRINPDGTFVTTVYSDWTRLVIDENDNRVRSTNNAYWNLVKVEEFNGDKVYTTTYAYDTLNNLISTTDAKGNTSTMAYDSLSRKVSMDDPDMGHWTYQYDAVGNLISQTDAKGQTIEFEYDALNRITKKDYPEGRDASYSYDAPAIPNSIGRLTSVLDSSGKTTYYYDKLGRCIKTIKVIDAATYTVQRTYDLLDRLTSIAYPDGETVNYTYNKQGQIETVIGQTTYISNIDYNASNQIAHIEYGNGTSTDYTYDLQTLRLTTLRTTNSEHRTLQDLSYQFDNVGSITAITDSVNTATQTFQYDDLNRLTSATGSYGARTYQYDSIGNMLRKGDIAYTYGEGSAGPHAVTHGSDGLVATYDANGNMTSKNGVIYQYDYENRLIEWGGGDQPEPINVVIPLQPSWNFISLPVIPDSWDLDMILLSLNYEFDYDQVSRYNPEDGSFEHYCHDPMFNQFDQMQYGRGYQIYITNSAGCTLTIAGRSPSSQGIALASGWNLIGAPTTSQITVGEALTNLQRATDYDRIVRYNPATQTFTDLSDSDNLNAGESYFIHMLRPATWTLPTQSTATAFVYDADGNRAKKVSPQATTIYVGNEYEVENGVATKHIFVGPNRICSKDSSGDTYYYHSDHIGSSNVITDGSGSQVQLIEYLPYGEIKIITGSDVTDYKFTGKELDQSTGLYYYGARYYDASVGRFITADPIVSRPHDPQDLNRYAYARNNPLIYIDPTGYQYFSTTDMWSGLGGFFSAAWDLSTSFFNLSWQSAQQWASQSWQWTQQRWSDFTSSFQATLNSAATSAMMEMEKMRTESYEFGSQAGAEAKADFQRQREERRFGGAEGSWKEEHKIPPLVVGAGITIALAEPTPLGEIAIVALGGYVVYQASQTQGLKAEMGYVNNKILRYQAARMGYGQDPLKPDPKGFWQRFIYGLTRIAEFFQNLKLP